MANTTKRVGTMQQLLYPGHVLKCIHVCPHAALASIQPAALHPLTPYKHTHIASTFHHLVAAKRCALD
jgi:hypothetical protein